MVLRTFSVSLAVTAVVLALSGLIGGGKTLALVAILAVLEVSLSFDNAVVNATVLRRMSPWWQRIFLTVGVLVAVFGMRLVFPLLVVGITARLNPARVLQLALNHPADYAHRLTDAHPAIAGFGGMFLLMIFLDFVLEEREITWLGPVERMLGRLGRVPALSATVALVALFVGTQSLASTHSATVLGAGILGMATYLAVHAISAVFESAGDDDDGEVARGGGAALATGKAAFALFLYLEVLDASFSFDGVIGSFAITSQIFVIAAGLGIGAMFIRSLTVYLVRMGTLDEYVYLEHGAHYAIGALAVLLFVTIDHDVPEIVTGLVGLAFITASWISSLLRNLRLRRVAGQLAAGPGSRVGNRASHGSQ